MLVYICVYCVIVTLILLLSIFEIISNGEDTEEYFIKTLLWSLKSAIYFAVTNLVFLNWLYFTTI